MGAAGEIEETGPRLGHPEKRRGGWRLQFARGLLFPVSALSPARVRAGVGHQDHDSLSLCLCPRHTQTHTQTIHPCSWGLSSLGRRVFLGRGRGHRAGGERERGSPWGPWREGARSSSWWTGRKGGPAASGWACWGPRHDCRALGRGSEHVIEGVGSSRQPILRGFAL